MKCEHRYGRFYERDENPSCHPSTDFIKRCLDCHELLSLGPSNDEGEQVRVEMRAAELFACAVTCVARMTAGNDYCQCFRPGRSIKPGGAETEARKLADVIYYEHGIAEHDGAAERGV